MSRTALYQLVKIAQHSAFKDDMAYALVVLALQRDQRLRGDGRPQGLYRMHQLVMPEDVIKVGKNLGNPEYIKQVDSMLRKRILLVTPKNVSGATINSSHDSHGANTPSSTSPVGNTSSHAWKTTLLAHKTSSSASCDGNTSSPASRGVKTQSPAGNTLSSASPAGNTLSSASPTIKTSPPTSNTLSSALHAPKTLWTTSPFGNTSLPTSPGVETLSPASCAIKTLSSTSRAA